MDIFEIYAFLFQTPVGVGILIGACLVVCVAVAFVLERRTRKRFVDRGPQPEDEDDWEFEDDE